MQQLEKPRKGYKLVKSHFGKYEEIPEEWEITSTSKIMRITMGQSPPSESYNEEKRGLPFYQGVTDFGTIHPNPTVWCTDSRKIAKENSILFSVRAPVGEINLTKTKCCLGRGVAALTPLENDLMYCYYLVNQNRNRFSVYSQGTTYDAINQGEIANTELPHTRNKLEQQKIASILSNVDSLIQQTQKIIEQTQRLKKGLMQKLLTKGIGHTKFKKSKFGLIPDTWEVINLEDACNKERGSFSMGPFGSDIKTNNFVSNGVPVIRGINLTIPPFHEEGFVFLTEEKADELKAANAFSGDVIFTHRGTLGQVGVIPLKSKYKRYVISQSQMKCTCKLDKLRPMFAFLFFTSESGQKIIFNHSTKSGVPHIVQPLSSLRKFPIILPDVNEQEEIISIISNINSKIEKLENRKSELENLKKGLMQKLLTGQIRVKV